MSSYCPLCGTTTPPGYGHACFPWQPLFTNEPGRLRYYCSNGCTRPCRCATPPQKRTICANCHWYRRSTFDSASFAQLNHVCAHQNARHLVTGEPTHCSSRNTGSCPDYQEKQP